MKKSMILLTLLCLSFLLSADSSKKSESADPVNKFTISGNANNLSGRAVRNVSITLTGKKQHKTSTDKNGDFELKNIPSGDYEFSAKHSDYNSHIERLSISNDVSLTIVLSAKTTGTIKGKVVDKAEKPLHYAYVTISRTGISSGTDNEGNYIIEDVPFGSYDVICQLMGFSSVKKENVTIKEAKSTELNFTLERTEVQLDAFMVIGDREELISATKTNSGGKNPEHPQLKEDSDKKPKPLMEEIEVLETIAPPLLSPGDTTSRGRKSEVEYTIDGMSVSSPSKMPPTHSGGVPEMSRQRPVESGLRAGYSDDNKQFNYFLQFLERFRKTARHIPIRVEERFVISCVDAKGKSVPNAEIRIFDKDNQLQDFGKTMADGTFLYFPAKDVQEFFIEALYRGSSKKIHHSLDKSHQIEIRFEQTDKKIPLTAPLDILFIIDTTGSMGEEIHRLKQTLEIIALNIESFTPKPNLRLGMILYKDKHDVYVTKIVLFTSDISEFQKELDKVQATGGGDYPEDLQSALYDSMKNVQWNEDGIRLAFIITDAPPHLDYGQEYTYYAAAKEAKQKATKLFSVGTGGLDVHGEYVLRQLSQYTSASYVFLTYGEKGESAGGKPGSVSHHTGENFQTDKLESIIIHFVREELRAFNDLEFEIADEYFTAQKTQDETSKETLELLFEKAFNQLVDYSSIKLNPVIPTAIAPLITSDNVLKANSEYFYDHMLLAIAKNNTFRATERRDLQPVLNELKFQLNALSNEENAAELGKFLGAKVLITGTFYEKENMFELILKLMNVETIEILSVTKVKVDKKLGL